MEMDEKVVESSTQNLHPFTKFHHGESPMNDEEYDDSDAKSVMVEPPSRVHSPSPDDLDYNDGFNFDDNNQSAYFQEQQDVDQNHEMSLQTEQDVKLLSMPTFSSETQSPSFGQPEANTMEL